jgi:phosphoribosyl-ATP pyrophosphohydrolase
MATPERDAAPPAAPGKRTAASALPGTTAHAQADAAGVLERLAVTIAARRGADPSTSYVASLFAKGHDAILKKIGEEATETVMAAKDGDKMKVCAEVADLWFHCLVLLVRHGLAPDDVLAELARREGISGHDEKAARSR